jgi:hypothetical protein
LEVIPVDFWIMLNKGLENYLTLKLVIAELEMIYFVQQFQD